jgi:hypothetical protein
MAEPAAGSGLSGDLHRLCEREDPRRERGEPADLRRARGDLSGHPGHPRAVGRRTRRRGGCEVLAAGAHRDQESRHQRCVHRGLRRAQRPAGGDRDGVAAGDHPDVCRSPTEELLPVCVKRDWSAIAKDLKPIYTAPSEQAALDRFAEFAAKWEKRYPAIIRLWENAWAEFVPFLRFDKDIRTVVCTTNAIESINARIRRAVNARGHFPTEQAALKCVYLALMSLDPTAPDKDAGSTAGRPR